MGDWYHGKLDRRTAEERLRAHGIPGAFLLRESDRKAGSFVLSYLGVTGQINHFRITHVYGCYFVGGRKFDSLLDLINYYTNTSDLLLNERLVYKVAPPEPISPQSKLFMAILPYTKLPQSDELSFAKGDILILQNDLGDSWYWCRHAKTGESGLVFSELVEEISSDIDPNEIYPWFHANISKTEAVEKLVQEGPGAFLVRPSDNSPGNYSLFYHVGPTVQRFRITRHTDNRYLMGGRYFESLGHVIDRYRIEPIVEGHYLRTAVTTHSKTSQLNEASALSSMKALEIKKRSHDIYATLRESREASKKRKQNSELVGWLWLKKNDMGKKWKFYYFVVKFCDKHLLYFEKIQHQSKPKGLIDLSCSYLYESHESLHDKPNCFQLVEKSLPCFSNFFYFHCDQGQLEYRRWVQSIKCLTSVNQHTKLSLSYTSSNLNSTSISDKQIPFVEEVRTISITFAEAHSIRTANPYFVVSFNQNVKMCRTQVKTAPTVIFEEDGQFVLENLPRDVSSFTITLYSRGTKKSSSDFEVAEVTFDLKRLTPNVEIDNWFELIGLHPPIRDVNLWASLRLKLHFTRDIIMPYSEYNALEDLILDTNLEVITALEKLHTHSERTKLAHALTNIFRYKNAIPHILKAMIEREINAETETSTLFRTSSLTTAIIECHFRTSCQSLIVQMLRDPIKRIIDNKISCELNPSRIFHHETNNSSNSNVTSSILITNNQQQQQACENLQNLLNLLDEFVERIFATVEQFPKSVCYICGCLQKAVVKKWPQDVLAKTRVVSTFLFLRLICPAILNPRHSNLIQETPSEMAARNLMLIAKCLQTMSNLAECSKEPWMEVVNPFILKNRTRLIRFINDLSDVDQYPFVETTKNLSTFATLESVLDGDTTCPLTPIALMDQINNNDSINNNGNSKSTQPMTQLSAKLSPANDLADVHAICESHRNKLDQLAATQASIKKLATISDLLTKHKQHYISNLTTRG